MKIKEGEWLNFAAGVLRVKELKLVLVDIFQAGWTLL